MTTMLEQTDLDEVTTGYILQMTGEPTVSTEVKEMYFRVKRLHDRITGGALMSPETLALIVALAHRSPAVRELLHETPQDDPAQLDVEDESEPEEQIEFPSDAPPVGLPLDEDDISRLAIVVRPLLDTRVSVYHQNSWHAATVRGTNRDSVMVDLDGSPTPIPYYAVHRPDGSPLYAAVPEPPSGA